MYGGCAVLGIGNGGCGGLGYVDAYVNFDDVRINQPAIGLHPWPLSWPVAPGGVLR